MDSALKAVALVAQLHQTAVDISRLQAEFGQAERALDADDILLAAQSLQFKARRVQLDLAELDERALPAIAQSSGGRFFVIAKAGGEGAQRRFLVHGLNEESLETLTLVALKPRIVGELILLTPKSGSALTGDGRFNLRWFLPSLIKYRHLFSEVLIASFFLQLFALVTPLFFQVVMDKVLVHRGFTTLNVLAFGFFVIVAFEAIVGGMRNFLLSHTSNRVDVELGARLFRHLLSLPLAYFEARQVGQTVARVRELETIRHFITGTALTLLVDLSFMFVFIAVLWYYSPQLTLIVLASLPCYVLLSVLITPLLRARLDDKFRHGAANQAFLTESVTGIETVKAQAVEPQMRRHWENQLAAYVTAAFRALNLNNIANQVASFISKLTTLGIIWWGAHLVIAGALTVGQLVAFNMIAGRISAPILKLLQLWQDFQQAGLSLRRLGDILNTPREPGSTGAHSALPALKGALQIERVRFRYRPDAALVLNDFSLSVAPGEIIGVVGRSGSGKSTFAKLLQRMYTPEAGRVLLDGVDLTMVDTQWLRRNIGVVQQESFLFNRSVRDNIALSNLAMPFDHIVNCAQAAGAHEFILAMPEGYDTAVLEQGSNLSGGQRQRLAIARALAANPRILIFDEATSALDYESERVIQENMGVISAQRTVFIIAHRLSAVRHCDRIIVLDDGHIVESGDHDALLHANGYYARLHSYQNQSPVIRRVASGSHNTAPSPGSSVSGAS